MVVRARVHWVRGNRTAVRSMASWVVVLATAAPLYWLLVLTFGPGSAIYSYPPPIVPSRWNFSSFETLFGTTSMATWVGNSAAVGVVTVIATVVFAVPCAHVLARQTKHERAIAVTILATQIVPAAVLIVPIYEEMQSLRMLNSLVGLVLLYVAFALPVATWLLSTYFRGMPRDLEDSASVDGCGRLKALVLVLLPNAKPAVATAGFFAFVVAWNDFVFARTLLVSTGRFTVSVGMSTFFQQYTVQWNSVMAGSVVAIVPVVVAYFGVQRFLVGGLLSGAVKG